MVIAILLVALAGVVATALAELGRRAVARAGIERDGIRAWYFAEAGLTDAVAALPAGRAFDAALAAVPGPLPAAGAAWTHAVALADDADDDPDDRLRDVNARVILHVAAFGPGPVRRRLEAVIGRRDEPWMPGAATLAGPVASLTPDFSLDGRDFDVQSGCAMETGARDRAGLSLPDGAGLPLLGDPAQVQGRGGTPSVARGPAPDLAEVAASDAGDVVAAGTLPAALGDLAAPRFTRVDGDAEADAASAGAGTLYVAGRLRVTGQLDFRGVVAAADGIELAPGGTLTVCGGLWAAGAPALDARGAGAVRASGAALRLAATVAPLPAAARVIAVREPS